MLFRLIIVFCALCCISAQAREYIIGVNERAVYRTINEQGQWVGKDIDLINEVFKHTPHTYKIVALPWARVLQSIENGSVDLTLAAAKSPERIQYAHFSSYIFRRSYYALFVRNDRATEFVDVTRLDDLAKKELKIGALRGAVYSNSYYELLKNKRFYLNLMLVDNDIVLPEFITKGRVDAYIESELEGVYYLQQEAKYRDTITPLIRINTREEGESYLMFSKKSVDITELPLFNNALTTLHESGVYEQISRKYAAVNAQPHGE